MLLLTWAIECSRLRDNRVPRNWESANTPRLPQYLRAWNRLHMQQSLGNMFVWQEAVVVSFTSNRPFYRYGGHIEFISFKEYYGMPRGYSLSIYPRRELHCLFLGRKAITITSKHRTTIFFSHYNRDFKIQRRGRQGERQKTIGFRSKTTLHVHHTFLYISLPVFARLRRENA